MLERANRSAQVQKKKARRLATLARMGLQSKRDTGQLEIQAAIDLAVQIKGRKKPVKDYKK